MKYSVQSVSQTVLLSVSPCVFLVFHPSAELHFRDNTETCFNRGSFLGSFVNQCQFQPNEPKTFQLVMLNLNVQSLAAHAEDISSDHLLSHGDFLVLTETWTQPSSDLATIAGFPPVHHKPCRGRSGGVALYKRNPSNSALATRVSDVSLHQRQFQDDRNEHPADITMTRIHLENDTGFLLVN